MAARRGGRHAVAAFVRRHDDAGHRPRERAARQEQRLQRAVGARGRQHDLGIRQVESVADRIPHLVRHMGEGLGESRREAAARARRLQLREGGLGRRIAASRHRAGGRGRQADFVRARRRLAAIEVQAVGRVDREPGVAARDQGGRARPGQAQVCWRASGRRLQCLLQPHRGPLSIPNPGSLSPPHAQSSLACGGFGRPLTVGRTGLTPC